MLKKGNLPSGIRIWNRLIQISFDFFVVLGFLLKAETKTSELFNHSIQMFPVFRGSFI